MRLAPLFRQLMILIAAAAILVFGPAVPSCAQQAGHGRRVALVIGNNAYLHVRALQNAVQDGRPVAPPAAAPGPPAAAAVEHPSLAPSGTASPREASAAPAVPEPSGAAHDAPRDAAPPTEASATCDRLAAPPVPLSPQAATRASDIDWPEAIAACARAASEDRSQPRYEFELGRSYEQSKNYTEAARHYRIAGDAGSSQGQYGLGLLYYKGLGVTVDKGKAYELFARAAQAGHPYAMEDLGVMFGNGEFVQRDDGKALEWFARAVAAGDAAALGQVGVAFFYGRGSPVDYQMAAHYFQQAADLGDGYSLKFLALMYERGLLGPPDAFKAAQLRQKAQEVDPNSNTPKVPAPPRTATRGGARAGGGGALVGGQGVLAPGPRHGVVATFADPNANQQFYHGTVASAPRWHGIPIALPHCWPICQVR